MATEVPRVHSVITKKRTQGVGTKNVRKGWDTRKDTGKTKRNVIAIKRSSVGKCKGGALGPMDTRRLNTNQRPQIDSDPSSDQLYAAEKSLSRKHTMSELSKFVGIKWYDVGKNVIEDILDGKYCANDNISGDDQKDITKAVIVKSEHVYQKYLKEYKASVRADNDLSWLRVATTEGSCGDRLSAISTMVEHCSIFCLAELNMLLEFSRDKVYRKAYDAIHTFNEIAIKFLLPRNEKLKNFRDHDRRIYQVISDDYKFLTIELKYLLLIRIHFEASLKDLFALFVCHISSHIIDPHSKIHEKCLLVSYQLLKERPEQEAALLTSLVRGFRHDSGKTISLLRKLIRDHPRMKLIVCSEVIEQLLGSHTLTSKNQQITFNSSSMRSITHAVGFFSVLKLDPINDGDVAVLIVDVCCRLLEIVLREPSDDKARTKKRADKCDSPEEMDQKMKLLRIIISCIKNSTHTAKLSLNELKISREAEASLLRLCYRKKFQLSGKSKTVTHVPSSVRNAALLLLFDVSSSRKDEGYFEETHENNHNSTSEEIEVSLRSSSIDRAIYYHAANIASFSASNKLHLMELFVSYLARIYHEFELLGSRKGGIHNTESKCLERKKNLITLSFALIRRLCGTLSWIADPAVPFSVSSSVKFIVTHIPEIFSKVLRSDSSLVSVDAQKENQSNLQKTTEETFITAKDAPDFDANFRTLERDPFFSNPVSSPFWELLPWRHHFIKLVREEFGICDTDMKPRTETRGKGSENDARVSRRDVIYDSMKSRIGLQISNVLREILLGRNNPRTDGGPPEFMSRYLDDPVVMAIYETNARERKKTQERSKEMVSKVSASDADFIGEDPVFSPIAPSSYGKRGLGTYKNEKENIESFSTEGKKRKFVRH